MALDKEKAKKLRRDGLTYQEIGNMFGVSRQAVHQCVNPKPTYPDHINARKSNG